MKIGARSGRTGEGSHGGRSASAARLFDVRGIIGGLFSFYGVIITIVGLLDNQAQVRKAQGIRINLWLGLALLALGLLFLLWRALSPTRLPDEGGATASGTDSADAAAE